MQADFVKVIEESAKAIIRVRGRTGGSLNVSLVFNLCPSLWIDFLNADPENAISIWEIYQEFTFALDRLEDWLDAHKYTYNADLYNIRLFTRDGFLAEYSKVQHKIEGIHARMRWAVSDEMDSLEFLRSSVEIREQFTGIPSRVCSVFARKRDGAESFEFDLPDAAIPGLWVSVLLNGMDCFYGDGKAARVCAANDCDQCFIPTPRSVDQRYCSATCQSRDYKRERRKKAAGEKIRFEDSMP